MVPIPDKVAMIVSIELFLRLELHISKETGFADWLQ
jgi:hypothetical protein